MNSTPTPPPAAPATTAMVIERLKLFQASCEQTAADYRSELPVCAALSKENARLLADAITHLAAHAELQARCARLEEDGKQMRDALNFIVSECDWEEGTHTGDNRIGTACHEALAARNAKEATP